MKLGIIGTGMIVQEFLPFLLKLKGMEIIGIQGNTMSKAKELCKRNGISYACSNFEELYETGIDTVYIAVPNYLHYNYCKMALEKGIHVIVEKPITSNLQEALSLKSLAVRKECFLFEAVTTLYLENYKKIKEWLPRIGKIKIVQSQYSQYSRRYDAFCDGQVLPAFDPEKAGGAMMDLNLYNLHFVMGLFGEPVLTKYYANIERKIDTSGILIMQYPEFQAFCLAAKDCRGNAGAVIQGTNGYIKTESAPNIIGKVTLELNDGTIEEFDDNMAKTRLIPEFTSFIRAINEKDISFCQSMLEKSIAVSRIQTEARLKAKIRFPADETEKNEFIQMAIDVAHYHHEK